MTIIGYIVGYAHMVRFLLLGLIDPIAYIIIKWWWIIFLVLIIIIICYYECKKRYESITFGKFLLGLLLVLMVAAVLSSGISNFFVSANEEKKLSTKITNKEKEIEKKLEKKYDKDFSFVAKEIKYLEDEDNPYYDNCVIYQFKDTDGVIAIVVYKEEDAWDYYQIKRAQYDIEQVVYNYAKKIGIKQEFYIKEWNGFEFNIRSSLDSIPEGNFVAKEMSTDNIILAMPEKIENFEEIIKEALKKIYFTQNSSVVYEYVVTENEYQNIKQYYEDPAIKNRIDVVSDSYEINEENIISYKQYSVQ